MRIMVMANSWNMRRSSMGLFQFFKLFNAHIFANSLCSHKHNLLKISAMHYVIYVVIQLEDHTKKWNHIWIRFLLYSQRTLNYIILYFFGSSRLLLPKKTNCLSNFPIRIDFANVLILMFFFGFAFGLFMIFDIPCLMFWFIKTTHLEKKRRHKILMWAEAKRMRSNRQSQRKIEQAVHYQWIGTILRPCLYYYVALHQLDYKC